MRLQMNFSLPRPGRCTIPTVYLRTALVTLRVGLAGSSVFVPESLSPFSLPDGISAMPIAPEILRRKNDLFSPTPGGESFPSLSLRLFSLAVATAFGAAFVGCHFWHVHQYVVPLPVHSSAAAANLSYPISLPSGGCESK